MTQRGPCTKYTDIFWIAQLLSELVVDQPIHNFQLSQVAVAPNTILNQRNKQSFVQSCYFLCINATCEMHIGTVSVHIRYL